MWLGSHPVSPDRQLFPVLAVPPANCNGLPLSYDIEDFRVLAQSARVPKTNTQIMDMTLTILTNCGCFTNALIEWKNRPEAEKTWPNLKSHFDTAHRDLQDASDMPIGGTSFQTNVLATQMAESVSNTSVKN